MKENVVSACQRKFEMLKLFFASKSVNLLKYHFEVVHSWIFISQLATAGTIVPATDFIVN